jgi:hypothetical protein
LLSPPLERHEGHVMVRSELLDRRDKPIESVFQQRRRRHRIAQIVVKEVAQAPGRLAMRTMSAAMSDLVLGRPGRRVFEASYFSRLIDGL